MVIPLPHSTIGLCCLGCIDMRRGGIAWKLMMLERQQRTLNASINLFIHDFDIRNEGLEKKIESIISLWRLKLKAQIKVQGLAVFDVDTPVR